LNEQGRNIAKGIQGMQEGMQGWLLLKE